MWLLLTNIQLEESNQLEAELTPQKFKMATFTATTGQGRDGILLGGRSFGVDICHDPNSERPKIWPMIPSQRFDPKGSSYSTLAINQNTLIFFFLLHIPQLEFSSTNNILNTAQKQQDVLIIITVQNKSS